MKRLTEKITNRDTKEVLAYRIKCRKDLEAVQKLGRLEDLEEQGKLIILPCKIGSRVYMIYRFLDEGAWEIEEHKIKLEDLENIGKTVFLTKKEAEEEIRRKENNQ